jgi:hypothetical protein
MLMDQHLVIRTYSVFLQLTRALHPAQGYLSVNYSDNYFFLSQRHPEVPRLSAAQLEAMKLFNQLAASDALRMEANLEPGDIQLLNNHVQVRSRILVLELCLGAMLSAAVCCACMRNTWGPIP